jgi:hypothetical protein
VEITSTHRVLQNECFRPKTNAANQSRGEKESERKGVVKGLVSKCESVAKIERLRCRCYEKFIRDVK